MYWLHSGEDLPSLVSPPGGIRASQTFSDLFLPLLSDCGTTALTYCSPPFSAASKALAPVSSVLQVRQDRNQSLRWLPDKPGCWMYGPGLCLHPMGGSLVWEISSHLLLAMLHKGRSLCSHTECCKFTHPFYWSLFLALQWPGCCSFSAELWSSHRGILVSLLLLTWCLCGVRKACNVLVCHLADILPCLF